MAWKFRHEGSPQSVGGLSVAQVLEGLADGVYEPSDEVMGPNETTWRKLEEHPQFAEVAAEIDPHPPRVYDDETHLDMNALIDVTMVLLIFFILTTSYAALQSRLDSADVKDDQKQDAIRVVDDKEREQCVLVTVAMENKAPVIRIEGKQVAPDQVETELKKIVRGTQKTTMLLAVHPKVLEGIVLPIQRDAGLAGIRNISRVMPDR